MEAVSSRVGGSARGCAGRFRPRPLSGVAEERLTQLVAATLPRGTIFFLTNPSRTPILPAAHLRTHLRGRLPRPGPGVLLRAWPPPCGRLARASRRLSLALARPHLLSARGGIRPSTSTLAGTRPHPEVGDAQHPSPTQSCCLCTDFVIITCRSLKTSVSLFSHTVPCESIMGQQVLTEFN